MDLLYNRILLYNRTISSLVLLKFTVVTFEVFDIIIVYRKKEFPFLIGYDII